MIPEEFEYRAPRSLDEAKTILGAGVGAKVLAGGMSLIPAMKHRLARPGLLVDLGRVPDLDGISERRGTIRIGANVTHDSILRAPELEEIPILRETAELIGDPQVRNRGTLAGSLVHADPAADWPAVFLVLDGEARLEGTSGRRSVAAADFFRGILTSAVEESEILTEVRLLAEPKRSGSAYLKLRQPASGFAIVGVAVQLSLDRRGRCERVAIGITGVNAVPFRAESLEERLAGETLEEDALTSLCGSIEELDPMEDLHATADYRRHLAAVFTRRAVLRAHGRAVGVRAHGRAI